MAIDVTVDVKQKFSHAGVREFMSYMNTHNCQGQALAIDANDQDIQTTGGDTIMLNGQPEVTEEDAALDISAEGTNCIELTKTAWATATAYTVGNVRWNSDGKRFRCIEAHTSCGDDEPEKGYNYEDKWEWAPHAAINGMNTNIADGYDQWFMVTAQADGTLNVWRAGEAALTGNAKCVIPQYDAKMYCPIGFMLVADAQPATGFILGDATDGDLDTDATTTFIQICGGPVFPHPGNWLCG